jgi:hypothetical protein
MIFLAIPQHIPPPSTEVLTFHFERPGVPVPRFTLTVHSDGTAVYQASYRPEVPKYSPYAATIAAQPDTEVTTNVTLTPATTTKLFDEVRSTKNFAAGCASKAKNIASSGKKTLTYTAQANTATCSYDYTEDKTLYAVTNTFEAIAFTLDEGRKLETKHRYDRLALDPETEYLVNAVRDGNAVELALIAPTLRSLADDPQVLERVRTRAANLLAQAGATP